MASSFKKDISAGNSNSEKIRLAQSWLELVKKLKKEKSDLENINKNNELHKGSLILEITQLQTKFDKEKEEWCTATNEKNGKIGELGSQNNALLNHVKKLENDIVDIKKKFNDERIQRIYEYNQLNMEFQSVMKDKTATPTDSSIQKEKSITNVQQRLILCQSDLKQTRIDNENKAKVIATQQTNIIELQ